MSSINRTKRVMILNDLCPGTIGHVAHGKSTLVKAISGVQTVRFKNELERNITIKLGYANAKIFKCEDDRCPRPQCYRYVDSLNHLMVWFIMSGSPFPRATRFHDEAYLLPQGIW